MYDISMVKLFKKKENYVLMHKNTPVLIGDYSTSKHAFLQVQEILSQKDLPVCTVNNNVFSLKRLNHWFRWRGIPGYRVNLNKLQDNLGIHDPKDLLDVEYALSVSDTYWLRSENDKTTWDEINFFHRTFDQSGFGQAMFSTYQKTANETAKHTPNNITCGYHRKAWFRRDDTLYLLKGGSPFYQQEPVNEWLAYTIAKRLGMNAVPYHTEIYENNVVSVCPAFTDENTDLVTCEDVLAAYEPPHDKFHYEYYMNLLKEHGITNAKQTMDDQMVLDYLLMNTDRHNQNHGILVDANTGQWLGMAPVFDTGTGLGCLDEDSEILEQEHYESCKMFNARQFSHDILLSFVDLKRYDFSSLEDIPKMYGNKLLEYRPITNVTNRRINDAYKLFYKRIRSIQKIASR